MRFEIYPRGIEGGSKRLVITGHEAKLFREVVEKSKFFLEFDRAWRVFHINSLDLVASFKRLLPFLESEEGLNDENLEITLRALNVDLFNLLSSLYFFFYQFIDANAPKSLNDDDVELINNRRKQAYDDCFAFRFFYRMRNHFTHSSMPIEVVFNADSGEGTKRLGILFDIESLLSRSNAWGSLKKELISGPKFRPVATNCIDFDNRARILYQDIRSIIIQNIQSSIAPIKVIDSNLDIGRMDIVLISDDNKNLKLNTYSLEMAFSYFT